MKVDQEPGRPAALDARYDPIQVEDQVYEFWLDGGWFHAKEGSGRPPFTIVIPPPNVTGSLHMGHALNNTLQDILMRWRRMQGYEALWVPGTDHAGIATQHVVQEDLRRERGLTKEDLGREAFIEEVWRWKEHYERNIINQLRRVGASCDWDRLRFTLDDGLSRAVREVFVSLYEKGLIYRGDYIINWCTECRTALSDIEVEHEEREGHLYYVRYPLVEEGGRPAGHVTVATTRPETILGDTAVAVHPDDPKHRELVGRRARVPLIGRVIPIVADAWVDPEFGTGAVKVTPYHDPNDFELGRRNDLDGIKVIDEDGRMTSQAGPYAGLDRGECRARLVGDLKGAGLLARVEEHRHSVGQCYRCDSVVEPLVSTQWFVRMKPLAQPAIDAVRDGTVEFVPGRFTRVYLNWMENVRDWCISRQLWWGHRIPAWYCDACGAVVVSREDPDRCSECGGEHLAQDPDVLDTWFSSALWPFSTLGWPDDTPDFQYFFPTSVLVTAYDIIFFWVARMIFSSLEFTERRPFEKVLIHGLIRDPQGRKMSKSLGNGINPLEVVDRYGADALRFSLVTGTTPGNDLRFSWEKTEACRNFANKIWNAARFFLLNAGDDFSPQAAMPSDMLPLEERWLCSRLGTVVKEVSELLEAMELGEAARVLYSFIWDEYCDWYIEFSKSRLDGDEGRAARWGLHKGLVTICRLLHPFMPFITEKIWQALPGSEDALVGSSWPLAGDFTPDEPAEQRMALLMEFVRAIRNLRAEVNLPPSRTAPILIHCSDPTRELMEECEHHLASLAAVSEVTFRSTAARRPGQALTAVIGDSQVFLPLGGLVDLERERERLRNELSETEALLSRSRGKLANPGFLSKAPADVVRREREREREHSRRVEHLRERLIQLEEN